jgi:serine/threonine protein kinase
LVLLRDEFGNQAVLRCLDTPLTADPGFQQAYPAEAAALAGLAEPRVAAAQKYVASASGAVVAVIRRRVAGATLSEVLGGLSRGLDSQTAAIVVRDALAALEALHARGIAHRSVRPERIVVQPDGTCVLMDAGLAPRPVDDDPAAALAADLAAIPDLYAACAGGELDGMRGVLHAALVTAYNSDRTGDQNAGEGAGTVGRLTAADLTAALDAVAADSFGTSWDDLGREQLAKAVRAHREPRLRVVEFLPSGKVPLLRRSGRGSHAGARRDDHDLVGAVANVVRQTGDQLLALWLNGPARRRNTGRASHALRPPLSPAFSRYAAPLIAFLITFGLVILVLADARSNADQAMSSPTQRATTAVAQTGRPNAGTGARSAPATAITTAAGAPQASSVPTTAMAAPPRVTDSLTPAPTTISALTITAFGYGGHADQAQAVVDVKTSGTATVTVTVVFTEPDLWFGLSGGTKTHKYTLSGKTEYTITASLRILHYCSFYERVVVAVVQVAASVPSSHAQASASRDLWTDYC